MIVTDNVMTFPTTLWSRGDVVRYPPATVTELVGALEAAGAERFGRAVRAVIGQR